MSFKNAKDPIDLSCFKTCTSCARCANKGSLPACNSCSGRPDRELRKEPRDYMDRCRCTEGILQYRLKSGKLVIRKFESNPFVSKVITDAETADERDWREFVTEQRERFNDPNFDPITLQDGTSTMDWTDIRRGR